MKNYNGDKITKIVFCIQFILSFSIFSAEVKLKDLVRFEGIRENQLTGYGLVVGLSGTGDTKTPVTSESLKNYLKNLGHPIESSTQNTKNIASVIITANLSSYSKIGNKIDVTVSSIGDAKSLEGGVLLQSPLKSAGGETIIVASGVISFGGKEEKTSFGQKNNLKTTGIIFKGGTVEKEISGNFFQNNKVKMVLENQDFSTLNTLQKTLEQKFAIKPNPISPLELEIDVPQGKDKLAFLAELENVVIVPDYKARVVINERTGTIIMGSQVAVDEVAVSKQGLSLIITGNKKQDNKEEKQDQKIFILEEMPKVSDIVDALNKVGATTKDIISILESLKKSGALHAEVIIQ